MNLFLYYVIQFMLGGGIIVGMSILATKLEAKFAAILYAMPIQFIIAAIFIYL